ncbi:MAG: hypothetical protein KBE91_01895 [Bacteroidia bacterium]|nr:hypothetical protein [Bacteroidia bacterium]MBP9688334.1 hypothetical protein [Bacteroidia bacterium]
MSDSKSFLKAISSSYAYMAANLLVSLWLLPYVLKFLSKSEYAVFAIIGDIIVWLALTSLGVGPSLNVRSGQLIAKKDYNELNTTVNSAFWGQLLLSSIMLLFAFYVALYPNSIIGSTLETENLGLVLFLLALGGMIGFIMQPLNGVLVANKQVHIDNYLKFGTLAIRTILTVLFLNMGMNLLALALSNIISLIVVAIITFYRIKISIPSIKINLANFKAPIFKTLINTGIWLTIGGVAGILIARIDNYVISRYFTLELVTGYVITSKLYTIADMMHQQLFNQSRPYFVQLAGKGDNSKFKGFYKILFNSSLLIAVFMGVSIMLINHLFITHWIGADFYLGEDINLLLCLNFILQSAVLPNRIILMSSFFKIKHNATSRLLEGIFKLILVIALIPFFSLKAILISNIIATVIFSNIYFNKLASELVRVPFKDNLLKLFIIAPLFFIPLFDLPFYKWAISILVLILIVGDTVISFKSEKEILNPIYASIYNKLFKKKT